MKMMRQICITLICLIFFSSLSLAQYHSIRDSVGVRLDSVARSFGYSPTTVSIIADSAVRPFINERVSEHPKAFIFVKSVVSNRILSLVDVLTVRGMLHEFISSEPPKEFMFSLRTIAPLQIETLDQNATIPSKPEHSFWDSVAQPILVTAGAALAIVLFFLVRS